MNRPPFASRLPLVATAMLASLWCGAVADERPNIIVILADDLGFGDVGFNGSREIPTPHIDRLAATGMRFTDGYVTGPVCGPSRAGFLTGRYQNTFGWYGNPNPVLDPGQGLPPGIPTVASRLREAGYATLGVGKWHMGTSDGRHPNALGFDQWFGFLSGGSAYFPLDHPYYGGFWQEQLRKPKPWPEHFINQSLPMLRNRERVEHDAYLTREFTGQAIAMIRQAADRPFFLYLAYNAPHQPMEVPDETLAKFPAGDLAAVDGVSPGRRAAYCAMVSELDDGVGRLLDFLEREGLRDNTLVWFLSDNGGSRKSTHNRPLRGYKGELYEGGIRVPFVVSWPAAVDAGSSSDEPVLSLDITATSLALAGGAVDGLDGADLGPVLRGSGETLGRDAIFWCRGRDGPGAVREGDYKLLVQGERVELYNLRDDPAESVDLAGTMPAVARRLRGAWESWNRRSQPPLWQPVPQDEWGRDRYQYSDYGWLKGTVHEAR